MIEFPGGGHSLKPIHGIHKGKPGLIIGAGPRLRHLKPEWLGGFVTFVVNSGLLKCPDADYYVSCDATNTTRQHWQNLADWNGTAFIHGPGGFHHDALKQVGLSDGRFYSFRRRRLMLPCRMRPTDDKTIIGYSSVHPAVHIAYLMGCDPIILIGCDCSWDEGKSHFYLFDGQPGDPCVIDNALSRGVEKRVGISGYMDSFQSACLNFWNNFANQNKHANIINASGGALKAFPEIAMSDLPKYAAKG